jgi:hypothetical protein
MPEDNAILAEFGDVVEIDGTHGPLTTNWEIIPITVLDRGRHVHCGGIVFTAYVTTDVIHWLLKVLFESCPALAHHWKALISHEDSAFIPAVELFMQPIELPEGFQHILCVMHKERNLVKKINRCGLARKDRERAASLFCQVIYSDQRSYVQERLDALIAMDIPRLTKYIGKHITPRLSQFAKFLMPAIFTTRPNTTSAAESMNRLLKVGMPGNQALVAARQWFTRRLNQHSAELQAHAIRRRNSPIPVEDFLGIYLEPEIRKKILNLLDSTKDRELAERDASYLVRSLRLPDVVYIVQQDEDDGLFHCNCSGMIQIGYPSIHQMAVIIHMDQLPTIGYFNPRWFTPAPVVRQRDQEDDVWTQGDMTSDEDIDVVNQAEGTEQSLLEVHDWDIDRTLEELPAMSTRSAYLTLFHFTRGICGMAARDHERSCRLLRVLHELGAEMTTPLVGAGNLMNRSETFRMMWLDVAGGRRSVKSQMPPCGQ